MTMMILNLLWTLFLFFFVLMILVYVHEFGHFLIARLVGVKVLRFSIGFGKVLWSINRFGTEFAISAIPLGGYVKMLNEQEGEVAPEEIPYAFTRKSVWKRMAIVLAGPAFNFLFAILAYWVMFMGGTEEIVPLIGSIEKNSIAAMAGLHAGQEIIQIDDDAVTSWSKVRLELISHLGNKDTLKVQLKDHKTGKQSQANLSLQEWHVKDVNQELLQSLGIHPFMPDIPLLIEQVALDSPAEQAGIKGGDLMVALNQETLRSWNQLLSLIAAHPAEKIVLTVQRKNQRLDIPVILNSVSLGDGKFAGFLGVQSVMPDWPADLVRNQKYSPGSALIAATQQTVDMFILTGELMGKMLVGNLSYDNVSGPVGIAKGARLSASLGFSSFLNFLALISLSLCMINLLPIPVLDGGYFLYYVIELVIRKPLSLHAQDIGMRIGMFLLLLLTALAMFNDLRQW